MSMMDTPHGKVITTVALLIAAGVIAAVSWHDMRHGKMPRIAAALGGYNILLLLVFIAGLLPSVLNGWASLFMGLLTFPFGMMLLMLPDRMIKLVVSGWFGNFVYILICGGINNLLLYAVLRRMYYPVLAGRVPQA